MKMQTERLTHIERLLSDLEKENKTLLELVRLSSSRDSGRAWSRKQSLSGGLSTPMDSSYDANLTVSPTPSHFVAF